MKLLLLAGLMLSFAVTVAACGGQTNRARLATAVTNYNAEQTKAIAYRQQPICAPGQVSVPDKRCADRSKVQKLQAMDKTTVAAIDDANASVTKDPDSQATTNKIAVVETHVNNFKGEVPAY